MYRHITRLMRKKHATQPQTKCEHINVHPSMFQCIYMYISSFVSLFLFTCDRTFANYSFYSTILFNSMLFAFGTLTDFALWHFFLSIFSWYRSTYLPLIYVIAMKFVIKTHTHTLIILLSWCYPAHHNK